LGLVEVGMRLGPMLAVPFGPAVAGFPLSGDRRVPVDLGARL